MYIIRIILLAAICIISTGRMSAQNILNKYDENKLKHGQWIEDGIVRDYNHGKDDGFCYIFNGRGELSIIYELKDGETSLVIMFNDDGRRPTCVFTNFVDVDTIVHGKGLTHRFKKKCKNISYHPNMVIESIKTCYLLEGGDDPVIDSFDIGKAYYYDEKGNLIETKELFFPPF